ncbi:hypothetical protein [Methylobacterium currus]|uniref:hypothetical protein n=1 Tax=Methylobacterium currus TaxID=2051553 RepID=UPI000F4F2AEC|nr:hypothetical protein [Methylobacterium currus]
MFADLWEQAVNICPGELCGYDGKTLGSIIHVERMKQYNFNISNRLGTLIREKESFDNISEIIKRYKASFHSHDPSISGLIDNSHIKILNLVRNVIVHNAAKYDAEYLKYTISLTVAPKGEIGADLDINAHMMHALLFPAMRCACSLILSVDRWLSNQRQNKSQM